MPLDGEMRAAGLRKQDRLLIAESRKPPVTKVAADAVRLIDNLSQIEVV